MTPKLYFTGPGMIALVITGLCFSSQLSFAAAKEGNSSAQPATGVLKPPKAEPKNDESKSVGGAVQSEIDKRIADKRAELLKDAQSALEETHNALRALDKGEKKAAVAALARATGKLELVVTRDPALALAPVSLTTAVRDVYSSPDTVRAIVKQAKDDLANGNVQQARTLMMWLASEEEVDVTNIPLGTYPAAIKAVAPLIDAGKTEDAKNALYAALNTLVTETYVFALPPLRAHAMLSEADRLAAKSKRNDDENKKLHSMIDGARRELQLGEALGYGTKDYLQTLICPAR